MKNDEKEHFKSREKTSSLYSPESQTDKLLKVVGYEPIQKNERNSH